MNYEIDGNERERQVELIQQRTDELLEELKAVVQRLVKITRGE
jgi:hypothetical protein